MRNIFLYALSVLLFASCVNFDDATHPLSMTVKLQQPDVVKGAPADFLSGRTVTLTQQGSSSANSIAVKTDERGIATFNDVVPDIYDISTSWTISSEEYAELTGSHEVVSGATVSGSLSSMLVSPAFTGNADMPLSLSPSRDIVISKMFYAGSKDNNNRTYLAGKYVELYNQSERPIDISGLYLGILEGESTPAYTLDNLHTAFADSVVLLKQIYRIPADKPYNLSPGASIVICNSAIDHTLNDSLEHNLTDADFEIKDVTGRYQNNPATPAMDMVYQMYNGTSIMNIVQSAPVGAVIFRTNDDVTQWQKVYAYGKSSGNQWMLCPVRYIIDGFEALRNSPSGFDLKTKRLYSTIDAGYTFINAASGWNGETVYRRTLRTESDGRRILMDTNNSTNDFKVSRTIQPREYDQ